MIRCQSYIKIHAEWVIGWWYYLSDCGGGFMRRRAVLFLALVIPALALLDSEPSLAFHLEIGTEFESTAGGLPLSDGDPIDGTEWLILGVRFTGTNMFINGSRAAGCDPTDLCLAGIPFTATFELNGLPAVTDYVHINYIGSAGAETTIRDVDGAILFQGPGDINFTAADILSVEVTDAGFGANSFFFHSVTVIPEPSTGLLFGAGLMGLALRGRRRPERR